MIIVELIVFVAAMVALWWVREVQANALDQQEQHLRRFANGVTAWRGSPDIPADAREAIEILVDMPLDKSIPRACVLAMLQNQNAPNLENNIFWIARGQLDGEKREAFDWLLKNYFLAMTYSAWFTGGLLRHSRVEGLSLETQAEVAIETVFSRGIVHARA